LAVIVVAMELIKIFHEMGRTLQKAASLLLLKLMDHAIIHDVVSDLSLCEIHAFKTLGNLRLTMAAQFTAHLENRSKLGIDWRCRV